MRVVYLAVPQPLVPLTACPPQSTQAAQVEVVLGNRCLQSQVVVVVPGPVLELVPELELELELVVMRVLMTRAVQWGRTANLPPRRPGLGYDARPSWIARPARVLATMRTARSGWRPRAGVCVGVCARNGKWSQALTTHCGGSGNAP